MTPAIEPAAATPAIEPAAATPAIEILAEGLRFPEGPVAMADGSVIVVEMHGERVTRCWRGRTETVATVPGGPNGAAIGPDGALWLCNNGGIGRTGAGSEGRIERVDLASGRVERVYAACDGIALEAPNDLVFGADGRLWFTDLGTIHFRDGVMSGKATGGLYAAVADGASVVAVRRGALSYNGVGLSPDGATVYVADTFQARLFRFAARAEPQQPVYVGAGEGDVGFDSLAVTAAGAVCVATLTRGGITTFLPSGERRFLPIPGERSVTNLAFGGPERCDAYVTLSGTGRLARLRWDEPGLRLAFDA